MKPESQKILLVDDDAAIRQILLRLLAEEGFCVHTAANGVEAVQLNKTVQFDLILLDLTMPMKSGWEVFEEISTKNPSLPFIVITGRANQLFPALASGVGALLEKPLDFVQLLRTIHQLLSEPAEVRLARVAGQTPAFQRVSPATEVPNKKLG